MNNTLLKQSLHRLSSIYTFNFLSEVDLKEGQSGVFYPIQGVLGYFLYYALIPF